MSAAHDDVGQAAWGQYWANAKHAFDKRVGEWQLSVLRKPRRGPGRMGFAVCIVTRQGGIEGLCTLYKGKTGVKLTQRFYGSLAHLPRKNIVFAGDTDQLFEYVQSLLRST